VDAATQLLVSETEKTRTTLVTQVQALNSQLSILETVVFNVQTQMQAILLLLNRISFFSKNFFIVFFKCFDKKKLYIKFSV
jgi:hypothetical protein